MGRNALHLRSGVSLIELIIFLAMISLTAGVMITVVIFTNEQRVRQKTIESVERQGTQILDVMARRIRISENILDPLIAQTGSILALQLGEESASPTIFAVQSGALLVAQFEAAQPLSSTGATVSNFVVQNTSATSERQSVHIGFTVTETFPIPNVPAYVRDFELLVQLFPDDQPTGSACSCTAPVCAAGEYSWEVCEDDACRSAAITLSCE